MNNFFKDLKVVEIASVLAGPATGMFFAELGAKVLKVENKKTGGDVTRSWKLPSENKNDRGSAYYYSVNLLKKIIFADLSNKKEKNKILDEIKTADIIIVNFKKGDDKKLGIDYNSIKKINPKIIYAAITGFGEEDDRLAYDLILQAESGFMSMNGTRESGPVKMPVALIDLLAAHQLKEGILLALIKKSRTNKGSKVSVSLYDAAISSLANQASNFLNEGFVPNLQGSLHPNIAPYGEIFKTRDKKPVTFAIGNDMQFKNLLTILKVEKLFSDKRFSSNQLRVKNRMQLFQLLKKQIATFSAAELKQSCVSMFVPFAQIKNLKEVFAESSVNRLINTQKVNKQLKKSVKTLVFRSM